MLYVFKVINDIEVVDEVVDEAAVDEAVDEAVDIESAFFSYSYLLSDAGVFKYYGYDGRIGYVVVVRLLLKFGVACYYSSY